MNPLEQQDAMPTEEVAPNELRLARMLDRLSAQDHAPLLKITCDVPPSPALITKIRNAGFHLLEVTAENHNDPEFMKTLDLAIYGQQHYSDRHTPPLELEAFGNKVAVLFQPDVLASCLQDEAFRYNWALNNGYGATYQIT